MLNIFNKVKFLKKIEKVYRISLFFPSTVSFAMENKNDKIIKDKKNELSDEELNNIIKEINTNIFNGSRNRIIQVKKIGKGGCGQVYLGNLKNQKNNEIALKIMENETSYINEFMILKNPFMNQPHLYFNCSIKDKNSSKYILGLHYYNYGDLRNFMRNVLKRKTLSMYFTCYIAGKVLYALNDLNRIKYAHMDIKPNNVLIDKYLNIVLTDFSASRKYEEWMKNFQNIGTMPYLAYELYNELEIKNIKNFFKPDIFSLGIMLYRLHTGEFPFFNNCEDTRNEEFISKCIEEKDLNLNLLESPKEYENVDVFKHFISLCLEKDVYKRPTAKELLEHPYIKVLYKMLVDEKEKTDRLYPFYINLLANNLIQFNRELVRYNLVGNKLIRKKNITEENINNKKEEDKKDITEENINDKKEENNISLDEDENED